MGHWLKNPAWVDALSRRRKDVDFDWLSESASAALKASIIEMYDTQVLNYVVPLFFIEQMIQPRLKRSTPLARTRPFASISMNLESCGVWWFDPESPDLLWLALDDYFPAIFWVPSGLTDPELDATLNHNFVAQKPSVGSFDKRARLYAGDLEQLQMELENFENHFAMTSPVSLHMWGSEFEYDPWPETTQDWAQIDRIAALRRHMVHRPGRVRATSFRTAFSKSVLTVEDHGGAFVFDIQYMSSPRGEHVAAFNATLETMYPLDLPADALAAILGFRNITEAQLRAALDARDYEYLWSDLVTLQLLMLNRVELARCIRGWLAQCDDPATRKLFIQQAYDCGSEALLYELWMTETDAETKRWLVANLLPQEVA